MVIADELRNGRLEQSCPDCGRWEAAGGYCSGCQRPMGPDDWYVNGLMARREVAREKAAAIASTRVKRRRGRPRADVSGSGVPSPSQPLVPVGAGLVVDGTPERGDTFEGSA